MLQYTVHDGIEELSSIFAAKNRVQESTRELCVVYLTGADIEGCCWCCSWYCCY